MARPRSDSRRGFNIRSPPPTTVTREVNGRRSTAYFQRMMRDTRFGDEAMSCQDAKSTHTCLSVIPHLARHGRPRKNIPGQLKVLLLRCFESPSFHLLAPRLTFSPEKFPLVSLLCFTNNKFHLEILSDASITVFQPLQPDEGQVCI